MVFFLFFYSIWCLTSHRTPMNYYRTCSPNHCDLSHFHSIERNCGAFELFELVHHRGALNRPVKRKKSNWIVGELLELTFYDWIWFDRSEWNNLVIANYRTNKSKRRFQWIELQLEISIRTRKKISVLCYNNNRYSYLVPDLFMDSMAIHYSVYMCVSGTRYHVVHSKFMHCAKIIHNK